MFLNRSDTNQPVQSQKMVRGSNVWIFKVEELYYQLSVAKTKALISSYCETDLRLCFRLCKLLVFPCSGSYVKRERRSLINKYMKLCALKRCTMHWFKLRFTFDIACHIKSGKFFAQLQMLDRLSCDIWTPIGNNFAPLVTYLQRKWNHAKQTRTRWLTR